MASRFLYLVRHGQFYPKSYSNKSKVGLLTTLGKYQARKAAKHLRQYPITKIFCSPLPRAVETTEIIKTYFPQKKVISSSLLKETKPDLPIKLRKELNLSPTKLRENNKRAHKAFKKFFTPTRGKDKHEIIVCHGNIIRYFVCKILNIPKQWVNLRIFNGSISVIEIRKNGKFLITFNETAHIPIDKQTKI